MDAWRHFDARQLHWLAETCDVPTVEPFVSQIRLPLRHRGLDFTSAAAVAPLAFFASMADTSALIVGTDAPAVSREAFLSELSSLLDSVLPTLAAPLPQDPQYTPLELSTCPDS